MSDDFSGVKVTFDKASYTTGDTIKATLSGKDVVTTQSVLQVTFDVLNPTDGATGSVAASVPLTKVDPESIVGTGCHDDQGHTWALSADKLSASTVA